MSVWDAVVGQTVVPVMQAAVAEAATLVSGGFSSSPAAQGMTHAWLLVGPPGSGRSVTARAFAAALQCLEQGCGRCADCRTAMSGSHPDVTLVATEGLSLSVSRVRTLVRDAALRPARGRWQVVVVEDADRLTEEAADALLLSVEEPPARTVWLLCAPTAEDVPPTIRSRSRLVVLRTPPAEAVATLLVSEGVDAPLAAFAARASQGHIGRARALATDEQARLRREEVLTLPSRVDSLASALAAAGALLEAAQEDAAALCDVLEERESADLALVTGSGPGRQRLRAAGTARKDLERDQKARRTRVRRDALDRALVDVLGWYRDVLRMQLADASAQDVPGLINEDKAPSVVRMARATSPEVTARHLQAVVVARESLEQNAAPLLTLEALAIALAER